MEARLVELIGIAIGVIMSLVFEFAPIIRQKFEALTKAQKQMVIGVAAVIMSVLVFVGNCAGILVVLFPDIMLTCDVGGGWLMVRVVITIIGSAQATHITFNRLTHFVARKIRAAR
jgi:hypothetical protein